MVPQRRFGLSGLRSRFGKRQAAEIIRSGLRLAARREKRAAIVLKEANPGLDVARMTQLAIQRELGTEERGA
jgi:hypothetical protein